MDRRANMNSTNFSVICMTSPMAQPLTGARTLLRFLSISTQKLCSRESLQ